MNEAALTDATETAVLVLVPAHLSVVYPFVPPADVDERVLERLAEAVAAVAAFDCVFARTEWFDAPPHGRRAPHGQRREAGRRGTSWPQAPAYPGEGRPGGAPRRAAGARHVAPCGRIPPGGFRLTGRAVVTHARLIRDVDRRYQVILGPDGGVMDGMHRIARAMLEGRTTIAAVR